MVITECMLTEESVSLTAQRREFRDYAQAGEAGKEFYRTVCEIEVFALYGKVILKSGRRHVDIHG